MAGNIQIVGRTAPKSRSIQQRPGLHFQSPCQPFDDRNRRIARAALQIADISPMDAGPVREFFLAPAGVTGGDVVDLRQVAGGFPPTQIEPLSLIVLQTISDIALSPASGP